MIEIFFFPVVYKGYKKYNHFFCLIFYLFFLIEKAYCNFYYAYCNLYI